MTGQSSRRVLSTTWTTTRRDRWGGRRRAVVEAEAEAEASEQVKSAHRVQWAFTFGAMSYGASTITLASMLLTLWLWLADEWSGSSVALTAMLLAIAAGMSGDLLLYYLSARGELRALKVGDPCVQLSPFRLRSLVCRSC